jgi:hypothetical protein
MKTQMLQKIHKAGAIVATILALGAAIPAPAGNSPQPGGSSSYGKTLAQWQEIYWRWAYGQLPVASDANGNAVVNNVVLMGLPAAPGDGTPASLAVTINRGQPFMLPLWMILGNTYTDGSADPVFALPIFQTLDFNLKIDGVSVVNTANVMKYYSQFAFNPPIPFDFPPAVSFSYLQGIGIVHAPLSPGSHTFHLDAKNTDSDDIFGLVFEYHNTWHVTVVANPD